MKTTEIKYILIAFITILLLGCDNVLNNKPKSELSTETFLTTEEGINSVLNGAYNAVNPGAFVYTQRLIVSHITSGIGWGMGGSFEQTIATPAQNFTWHSSLPPQMTNWWSSYYEGIRNANIVINNIDNGDFSEEFKTQRKAEAKALRAYLYYELNTLFGPVPIFTKSDIEDFEKERPTKEEIENQIVQDLNEVISVLPVKQNQFGRITRGAALGLLCKFYLNTKQWQKTINTANEITNLEEYGLVSDYQNIYSHDNEAHMEVVWPVPNISAPREESSILTGLFYPPDYPLPGNLTTFAARNYVFDQFIDSFSNNDNRKNLIQTQYINTSGETVQGYGNDKSLFLKYPLDTNATGADNGIDFIAIRYADILLSKAEALNEINGPNQESINLINQIRNRAGVSDVSLSDYSSKEDLRDFILDERLREFYLEGMERIDLIRHGEFIPRAQSRGLNAQEYHKLFPIPQREIDANSKIEQNPGY